MADRADLNGIVDHEALIAIARLLNSLLLTLGSTTERARRIRAWCMAPPAAGDLVVEISSIGEPRAEQVGLLESWAGPGWELSGRVVLLVQVEPRYTCTWGNAQFIRLPKNTDQWREALNYTAEN